MGWTPSQFLSFENISHIFVFLLFFTLLVARRSEVIRVHDIILTKRASYVEAGRLIVCVVGAHGLGQGI